jgi:hypothetical protein
MSWGSERWAWSNRRIIINRRKPKELGKACSSDILSTVNLKWNHLELNPGLCCDKPASDCLSYSTAWIEYIWRLILTRILLTFCRALEAQHVPSWLCHHAVHVSRLGEAGWHLRHCLIIIPRYSVSLSIMWIFLVIQMGYWSEILWNFTKYKHKPLEISMVKY